MQPYKGFHINLSHTMRCLHSQLTDHCLSTASLTILLSQTTHVKYSLRALQTFKIRCNRSTGKLYFHSEVDRPGCKGHQIRPDIRVGIRLSLGRQVLILLSSNGTGLGFINIGTFQGDAALIQAADGEFVSWKVPGILKLQLTSAPFISISS